MIGEVLAGLNILEKLGKFSNWLRGRKAQPVESVATRFVRLFESHGVHRNQLPRFIGLGLTLQDVQNDAALLAKVDEPLLDAACKRFAVRREWLDGAEGQVHPCHDFYKNPQGFAAFLAQLKTANPDGGLGGVLLAPNEMDGRDNALIVLEETVGRVGDKAIYRYHLCNNWLFSYWKARAYLTACIAIAWKRSVHVQGLRIPGKEIEKLAEGETLLGWQGERVWKLIGRTKWYPEDMALKSEVFLEGVDPERDNFGIKSGLQMWLDLEEEGLMDPGVPKENARQLFQNELAKYS